jgi:type II secretory pathway component PulF
VSTYSYQAIDALGARSKGQVQAQSREEAYRKVIATGVRPVRITTTKSRRGRKKITLKDLSHFTHQLAVVTEAKIPFVEGIRTVVSQENNLALRDAVQDIAKRIESGSSITESFEPYREVFGDVYVETVSAAEKSGNIAEVLTSLATILESQYDMTKKIKGALMYPACVVVALGLALAFLLIVVIPRFEGMFIKRGLELPLPTQIVIGVGHLLRGYWYLILGGGGLGVWMLRRAWHTPRGRVTIDGLLHRVPFVRDVLKGVAINRFATILGISLRSGLDLISALKMAGRASGRPLLRTDIDQARAAVESGARLSDVITGCSYLPDFPQRMIATGDVTNNLPTMCDTVAKSYSREVDHLVKNIATILEPILIVGLTGIVLVIALAVFLPLWDMSSLIA